MATTRVSTTATGTQVGNGASAGSSAISGDGTKVAFYSISVGLVPGDTNQDVDAFVKDLGTGAITRASVAADGTQANGRSGASVSSVDSRPSLSADGTRIAFQSRASNLVAGDTNAQVDIFVKDLGSGAITRVSTAADGSQANGVSSLPSLSADGTSIAFQSTASNLVPGDTNNAADVFVKDLRTGAISRASVSANGSQASGSDPALSGDGSKVAFLSSATNLVAGDTNLQRDVFVKDLGSGAVTRASVNSDGTQLTDGANFSPSSSPSITADGSRVAFNNGAFFFSNQVYVKDVGSGALTRASTSASGVTGDSGSANAAISADGTRVAFESFARNLVPGDTNNPVGGFDLTDVFVKELATGSIFRVDVANDGTQANNLAEAPSISANGNRVTFTSPATNLVPGDTNESADAFVADVPCFASGTRIRTPEGEVWVESLAAGDLVLTASGEARPVHWLGHRRVDCARHPRPEQVWPIRVRAGALGPGLPVRDLLLSPDHSVAVICVDEVLVPIKCLVDGSTIAQIPVPSVTYWHVELGSHDILLAEGLPAESYLDTGNRAGFANGQAAVALHPNFGGSAAAAEFCRPMVQDGPVLSALRNRLERRAEVLAAQREAEASPKRHKPRGSARST